MAFAASWLLRYDALLRERDEELRRIESGRLARRPGAGAGATRAVVVLPATEAGLPRRKRSLPTHYLPTFLPPAAAPRAAVEQAPAPPAKVESPAARATVEWRPAASQADVGVGAFSEADRGRSLPVPPACVEGAPAAAPTEREAPTATATPQECEAPAPVVLIASNEAAEAVVPEVLAEGVTDGYASGAEVAEAAPRPEATWAWEAVLDDGATDPMALPPIFTLPPPIITIFCGRDLVVSTSDARLDEVTEPFVPDFSPAPSAAEAPSARMPVVRMRPLDLTPPSLPIALSMPLLPPKADAAPAPGPTSAAPGPGVALAPLPLFELPNPWANAEAPPPAPLPEPRPVLGGVRLRAVARAVGLALVAAMTGVSIRSALVRTSPSPAAALATPSPPATLPASPLAAPVAPASLAPAAGKIEGTLEIAAPPGMTIAVDGIERGTGPHLSLPLAPGYHMVRVGSTITQLVQVHTKAVASVDLSARR